MSWFEGKKYELLVMPNQQGKSTAMAIFARAEWSGMWPRYFHRDPEPRSHLRGRRILFVAETYDHLREDVVPKLEPFIPAHMLAEPPRTEERCPVEFKSIWGSVLKLMTYKQSRKIYEGWQTDRAFLNEPPPQDIFNAIVRGQVKRKGRVCMGFTPVPPEEEGKPMHDITWVRDDLLEPAQRASHPLHEQVTIHEVADIHANCITCNGGVLDHDELLRFEALLPDHEKAARVYGRWPDTVGIEFGYVSRELHVVPDFEIPAHYPLVLVVDPHPKKGLYGIVASVDQEDDWFLVHAFVVAHNAFSIMCKDMRAHLESRHLPHFPDKLIMDQRGGKATVNMEAQEDFFRAFAREGFPFAPSRQVEQETLHEWLRPQWRADDGQIRESPKLRICRSVASMERGPLWALNVFQHQPEASLQVQGRAKGKDWIDCMRYLAGHPGLSWEKLSRLRDPMDTPPQSGRLVESYVPRAAAGRSAGQRPRLFVGRPRRGALAKSYSPSSLARFRIH